MSRKNLFYLLRSGDINDSDITSRLARVCQHPIKNFEINCDMILAPNTCTLYSSLICRWDFYYIFYSFWDINDNYFNWPINQLRNQYLQKFFKYSLYTCTLCSSLICRLDCDSILKVVVYNSFPKMSPIIYLYLLYRYQTQKRSSCYRALLKLIETWYLR